MRFVVSSLEKTPNQTTWLEFKLMTANELKHTDETIDKRFLERAEQARLQRECFFTLDLRELTAKPCQCYNYRGRDMWLDDESRNCFLDGLRDNLGVFTAATYEQIIHRFGVRSRTEAGAGEIGRSERQQRRNHHRVQPAHDPSNQGGRQQLAARSSVFEFGYFEKRSGARIKHTLPVLLMFDGRMVPAETRDISHSGLQVRTRVSLPLAEGDQVHLRVSPVTGADSEPGSEAAYRVVHVKSLLGDTILALNCTETGDNRTLNYLRQLVTEKARDSQGKKLDSEDALLTSYSLLAERYYMRSSSTIPFFLFKVRRNERPIRLVFSNPANLESLRVFESGDDGYDFSMLADRKFLRLLATLAKRESQADILLAVHQQGPDAAPAYRFSSLYGPGIEWYQYLADHMDAPGLRVFKVVGRQIRRPIPQRVKNDLEKLSSQSVELTKNLLLEVDRLIIAGALIDVTAQIKNWDLSGFRHGQAVADSCAEPLGTGNGGTIPEVRPISFIEENRREPRFLSRLPVECRGKHGRFSGRAKDISVHGLSLTCDESPPEAVAAGDTLHITFPKIKSTTHLLDISHFAYRDIPFEVIAVDPGNPTTLRLRQIESWHGRRFAKAFRKYLDNRKRQLPLELSHLVRATTSSFYSSVFIESTATIPVFIFRRPNANAGYHIKAGIAQSPSYLASFFEIADGEFDFQVFDEHRGLDKLLLQLSGRVSAEGVWMLRKKKIPGTARFRIRATQVEHFVNRPPGEDYCWVKLVVCKPLLPPAMEVEQAISKLQRFSDTQTDELKHEFNNLVAIGDLVDITGQSQVVQRV